MTGENERFAGLDLGPDAGSNHEMGTIFEELLRRFSEMSNETAGEHYTPALPRENRLWNPATNYSTTRATVLT